MPQTSTLRDTLLGESEYHDVIYSPKILLLTPFMCLLSDIWKVQKRSQMKIKIFNSYQSKKHSVKILVYVFLVFFFPSAEISKLY